MISDDKLEEIGRYLSNAIGETDFLLMFVSPDTKERLNVISNLPREEQPLLAAHYLDGLALVEQGKADMDGHYMKDTH